MNADPRTKPSSRELRQATLSQLSAVFERDLGRGVFFNREQQAKTGVLERCGWYDEDIADGSLPSNYSRGLYCSPPLFGLYGVMVEYVNYMPELDVARMQNAIPTKLANAAAEMRCALRTLPARVVSVFPRDCLLLYHREQYETSDSHSVVYGNELAECYTAAIDFAERNQKAHVGELARKIALVRGVFLSCLDI